ncbi:MAG: polysaccharide deacetylase family protein [Bacillus sp. (in: Bacteria)]|nr:polysaccharide deacetylase family protein [Bacillus sp. (in: firmicutes)]MCM1426986.1 polysaccharide deacetylase family protein [Eubacterium sp.]
MAFKIHTMLFPKKKRKALTFSYDDGRLGDRHLVEIMNRYGAKGTFNLNSARLGSVKTVVIDGKEVDDSTIAAEEIASLYERHEVATHTAEHIAVTDCGSAALCQILEDRKVLEGFVPYMVTGHAYPFGIYDKESFAMLKAAGIRYARTVTSTGSFALPKNFLEWHPTCHHEDACLMELAKQFCEQDAPFMGPQLFYVWGHSFEFDRHDNWEIMESLLSYLAKYADVIWMATNGEIVDYVTAYQSLVYSADGSRVYNPSLKTVWMESEGKAYEIAAGATITL